MIFIILGAIFNRIRGGWLTDLVDKTTATKKILIKLKIYRKNEVQHVRDLNATIFAITYCLYFNIDIKYIIIFYLSMRLAASFGWGGYIEGMISKEIQHNRNDVGLLDKWFRSDRHPVASSCAALSFRGVMWSTSIYLAFLSLTYFGYEFNPSYHYIPLLGFAMGSIYLASCEIMQRITIRGNGWQLGEVLFGAYIWFTPCLLIN